MFKNRWNAFLLHLSFSALLILAFSFVVFGFWYPSFFVKISGGLQMFFALVGVDLVIGPVLTLIVFSKKKSTKEIFLDMSVIVLLQMTALAYGAWSLAAARPSYLVYEYGQYTIVREMDMEGNFSKKIPEELKNGFFSKPRYVALRPMKNSNEQYQYTMDALAGVPLALRAELWVPYEESLQNVSSAAQPVSSAPELVNVLKNNEMYRDGKNIFYLPLQGVKGFWSVVLNDKAEILDFVEWDPLK